MIQAAVLIVHHLGQRPTLTPTGSLAPTDPRWMCRAGGSPSTRCVTVKLRENARRSAVIKARPAPLQPPALSPNGYSALVVAVFRAEAAGSFFAAVPGLPGSGPASRPVMAREVCGGGR
jgi:hypothetical protein